MATVTGFTADRMLEIENTTVVGGRVEGDILILITREGDEIVAGDVRGAPGEPGPPGSGGGGGASIVMEKTFTTAATSWVFPHALNTKGLNVQLIDSSGKIFDGEVSYPDSNTVRADFYYAQAGIMRINT